MVPPRGSKATPVPWAEYAPVPCTSLRQNHLHLASRIAPSPGHGDIGGNAFRGGKALPPGPGRTGLTPPSASAASPGAGPRPGRPGALADADGRPDGAPASRRTVRSEPAGRPSSTHRPPWPMRNTPIRPSSATRGGMPHPRSRSSVARPHATRARPARRKALGRPVSAWSAASWPVTSGDVFRGQVPGDLPFPLHLSGGSGGADQHHGQHENETSDGYAHGSSTPARVNIDRRVRRAAFLICEIRDSVTSKTSAISRSRSPSR